MAKKPVQPPSVPVTTRPRGRPPKPDGRILQVEVERAYRARLAAAGKVVRVVDAVSVCFASASLPMSAIPDFDPARDGIYERKMIKIMRDNLRNALLKLERRVEDVARVEQRNTYLEGELKLQERHNTNALKEIITLKQQLAKKKPASRRAPNFPALASRRPICLPDHCQTDPPGFGRSLIGAMAELESSLIS